MKTFIKILSLVFTIGFSIYSLQAQENKPQSYYIMDYMKVEPGMHAEYLKLEKVWKKIHKANIDAGKYTNWTLARIEYPIGTNEEYNYMTRINISGEAQLGEYIDNWEMPDLEKLLTKEERDLVDRSSKIRTFVKTEVWSLSARELAEDMDNADINVFNFFDFPEGTGAAAHTKVETELWQPVHKARINDGIMKGWVLVDMELPYGSAQTYHSATVDIYESTEQYLTAASPKPYFEKIHPNKTWEQVWDETRKVADLVRSELRSTIDSVKK